MDVDRVLALFAEGIAGRPYHIKSSAEFRGEEAGFGEARHDRQSVYLPETIADFPDERLNAAMYRLLVLDQLGFREFGTYAFDIAEARRRLPQLPVGGAVLGERESDLSMFFAAFPHPDVARAVFRVVETARVRAAVGRRYPGTLRYREALRRHRAAEPRPGEAVHGELAVLAAGLDGIPADSELLPLAIDVLAPDADVYASAAATLACVAAMRLGAASATLEAAEASGPAMEWLQREARLDDWDEQLAELDGEVAALEFAESQAGDEIRVGEGGEEDGGSLREVGRDLVTEERDRLKRRIEMERSAVRRALGEERKSATSFRYDEWDYHRGAYRRGWCRLFEDRLATDDAQSRELVDAVRPFARAVRRQFEQVRPGGYQRVKKTPEGDELDLDAIIQTRADIRAGVSPDERVYSRRERLRRDVAAAFLVDLSASTDDLLPEEREAARPADAPAQDIRDPFFDEDEDYDFAARMAAEAAKRRIIDILREAALLMATALEGLGDRYGVYGFSGYGRDCVEFYVAKEFDDRLDDDALAAIAAMKPKRSTRMGPAVRHAAAKLEASGSALKVLMIVSDGFPQDHDYGPERGEHEYGVQDTAKALREAEALGIETFCVTVDRSGHDYLRRMCPDDRYMVIEETAELPDALQKAYRQLTRI